MAQNVECVLTDVDMWFSIDWDMGDIDNPTDPVVEYLTLDELIEDFTLRPLIPIDYWRKSGIIHEHSSK